MEVYRVICSEEEESLVYAISLVDDPANESHFIALSKDKTFKLEKEKRLVTGVVLIPNQKIYRYNEKFGEFYLTFEEEEIRQLSQNFYRNKMQSNSNINHDENQMIKGLTFVENWIVEDPSNDKANALGFKGLPKGTWMASAYIEDDATWEKVKSGEVKGFSIESMLEFEKIEMSFNKNNKKTNKEEKMSLLKQLISLFSSNQKLEAMTIETDLGPLMVDKLEVGGYVAKEVDGEMVTLTDSVFVYEGMVYTTDSEGYIKEVTEYVEEVPMEEEKPAEEGKKEEEVMEDIPAEEAPVEDKPIVDEIVEAVVEEIADVPAEEVKDWKALYEEVVKQLDEIMAEKAGLMAKVEELSKEPATTKLKATIPSKGIIHKDMTKAERRTALFNSLK